MLLISLAISCAQQPDDKAVGMATLVITPETKAIKLDEFFQYVSTFKDARGDVQTNVAVIWKSSDDAIATVSDMGEITSVSAGQVEISATVTTADSGTTQSNISLLTIVDTDQTNSENAVATVKISNTIQAFLVGDNEQILAEAFNINDDSVTATTVSWSSSDQNVADIEVSTGNVSFLAAGMANYR